MKRFLIILFFLATNTLSAQWNVGIKYGVVQSSLNYDQKFLQDNIEQDIKLGNVFGLTFQYFNQPHIGLQMEALYTQKGFKTKYDTLSNTQYQRDIDYLTIPMSMYVYIGKGNFNINLILGAFCGYALSSNEIYTEGDNQYEEKYQFDREFDNRFEFGLQGGIGIRNVFNFGILELQGNFSYNFISIYKWGVSNNDPDKDKYFEIPETAQTQGLQITLSYYRTIGKAPTKQGD